MMKALPFSLLIFNLLITPWAAGAQTGNTNINAEIDKLLQAHYKPDGSGVALLAARKNEVIYHKAMGMANLELNVPMRTDHVFRIGSVTKQFTGAAIMQLVEQGKLGLEDEITRFIPDYPTHGKKITVRHLLTHTSGIKSYTDMQEWDPQTHRKDFTPLELIEYFKNQPMDFDPDAEWRYNNSGYILLGYIIEKVSGESYPDYVENHFFKPLGMKNSYYGHNEPVIKNRASGYSQGENGSYSNAAFLSMTQPYAAGSLLSTVEDLFIWTRALHSGKVIKPESFQQMTTPYILPDGTNTYYGFGLQMRNLLGSQTVEHSGGIHGFLSDLVYLPKEEVCVAILTNCDCEPPSALTHRVAALLSGKEFQPKAVSLLDQNFEQYTGVFENDKKEQRIISFENGQLFSKRIGGNRFRIQPYAKDQFFFEESFARIKFVRDQTGNITQAVVSDINAENNLWVKTDKAIPAARAEISVTEAQLEVFLGEYQLAPGFSIKVTRAGTQLYCQATGQDRFEVFPSTPTRFFLKVVEADIEFYPDETGKVNKMILFQNGQKIEGKRVQ